MGDMPDNAHLQYRLELVSQKAFCMKAQDQQGPLTKPNEKTQLPGVNNVHDFGKKPTYQGKSRKVIMLQDKLSLSKVRSMLHEYPVSPASQQRRTDTSASALAGDSAHVTIHCWKAPHRLMKT